LVCIFALYDILLFRLLPDFSASFTTTSKLTNESHADPSESTSEFASSPTASSLASSASFYSTLSMPLPIMPSLSTPAPQSPDTEANASSQNPVEVDLESGVRSSELSLEKSPLFVAMATKFTFTLGPLTPNRFQ
jgi:hypothetical protein